MPENNRFNDEDTIRENRVIKEDALLKPLERKTRRRRFVYAAMVIIAAAAFFTVVFTVFFKISSVTVTGTERYEAEDIAAAAGIEPGEPLYSFGSANAAERIKSEFPYVKEVNVTRRIPSSVEVEVTEETPAFVISVANDAYIVSDSFKVLERLPAADAPEGLVRLNTGMVENCTVGSALSFRETKLLDSLKTLWQTLEDYSQNGYVDYIDAVNRFDIYFGFKGRIRVYLGDARECDAKIRFFIKIMEHIYDEQSGTLDISDKKEATFAPYDTN